MFKHYAQNGVCKLNEEHAYACLFRRQLMLG